MEVPGEAHDTGYHTDQVQLWVSVADGQEAAYLVGPTGKPNAGPRSSSDARHRILTLAIPRDVGSSAATLGEPPSRPIIATLTPSSARPYPAICVLC